MKKLLLLLSAILYFIAPTTAQTDKEYDDLLILYMDGKYEKLMSKSESYATNDKTKKDPLPYLFASKAYYEMSKDEQYAEDYPPDKAFRSALKWAAKYRKKDREGALMAENELYFEELKKAALVEGNAQLAEGDYNKAKRFFDAITDFDPNDPGAWMMLGYCEAKLKITESKNTLIKAGAVMSSRDLSDLSPTEQELLKDAIIYYTTFLKDAGMRDSARTTMDMAMPVFGDDKEYQLNYSEIK